MNILILGSGGREHAIADKIIASSECSKLLIAPGNAGTSTLGKNVPLDIMDFAAVKALILSEEIELVVVGPEAPLVAGIVDYFEADEMLNQIAIIGPSAQGAMLEGSKDFAKEFMARHQIPTASYVTFGVDTLEEGLKYLDSHPTPVVLKA
ncbi:MAG: phosphoribosylamine--glycine ligase, partial [Bacteroidota bacterium]|nr:phosphoribosylamine--glycine ligase [Bacteroidota bacterium]